MVLLVTIAISCLIAGLTGWRRAASESASVQEFLRDLMWAYLWSAAWVFVFVLASYGLVNASTGGALDLAGTFWIFGATAVFFVPVTGITFVLRAMQLRRRA